MKKGYNNQTTIHDIIATNRPGSVTISLAVELMPGSGE
jgi:hypothetical protein